MLHYELTHSFRSTLHHAAAHPFPPLTTGQIHLKSDYARRCQSLQRCIKGHYAETRTVRVGHEVARHELLLVRPPSEDICMIFSRVINERTTTTTTTTKVAVTLDTTTTMAILNVSHVHRTLCVHSQCSCVWLEEMRGESAAPCQCPCSCPCLVLVRVRVPA